MLCVLFSHSRIGFFKNPDVKNPDAKHTINFKRPKIIIISTPPIPPSFHRVLIECPWISANWKIHCCYRCWAHQSTLVILELLQVSIMQPNRDVRQAEGAWTGGDFVVNDTKQVKRHKLLHNKI